MRVHAMTNGGATNGSSGTGSTDNNQGGQASPDPSQGGGNGGTNTGDFDNPENDGGD